ncbi:MAG: mechanosensitive ion channel [Lentimicrobiaceae bacterium]|nr:mechanosensitive ion channel [Lentimicrobiaceae bacterium]
MFEKLVDHAVTFGIKIIAAIIIYFIGRWVIKRINLLVNKMFLLRRIDSSLASFLQNMVSILLNFIFIVIIIGILGIDTTSLVALLASAGLAVGMALSGTLQNFAGGVIILLFKPFRVGDVIEGQGQQGTVKEIQIFNTIINTFDNKVIIIPNSSLSTSILVNYSREKTRRVNWTFSIAYGDNYDKAKAVLKNLCDADTRILKEPKALIEIETLNTSSVDIVVRVWVNSADYWDVFFSMNEKVYKEFAKEGLNIPFPQMDVYLHKPEESNPKSY